MIDGDEYNIWNIVYGMNDIHEQSIEWATGKRFNGQSKYEFLPVNSGGNSPAKVATWKK